jgi:hypothetical protein
MRPHQLENTSQEASKLTFLFKDHKYLANISPILYNKIETLADME